MDNDTWTINTKTSAGIVAAGGLSNTIWKTDVSGNPSWGLLEENDIPDLSWNRITSDKPTTLSGYGITDGISSSHIVKGIIDGNSRTIITGEGFTFEYIARGHYTITFSNPFIEVPICVANDNGSANYIIGTTPTTDYVDIWVRAHNGSEGNTTLSFIVIGN
jgi:hypothetical protein